jgi:hypothetical protein
MKLDIIMMMMMINELPPSLREGAEFSLNGPALLAAPLGVARN